MELQAVGRGGGGAREADLKACVTSIEDEIARVVNVV